MSQTREKIIEIIADELGVDPAEVTENAHFSEDLGADSLDIVELVMRFEEEFDIAIPVECEPKFTGRVGDAIGYLEGALNGKQK